VSAPRLAWYGDDFTGSAAVMDEFAQAGLSAALFTAPPDAALAQRFEGFDALGLAGTARARGPAWMREQLPAVFDWLEATGAALLHYKICSTFDSSPEIGSIGLAAEIGLARIGGWAPCLTAAPSMGRWQCYGTLFARGPDGRTHRLDRHPVMSRHPSTPMAEADLARHLAAQTDLSVGLLDLGALPGGVPEAERRGIVLIDAQREADMAPAGRVLAEGGARLLLGSQGVEMALVAHWREVGALGPPPPRPRLAPARLAVASGSVSAATAAQIAAAEAAGFATIPLDPVPLLGEGAMAEAAVAEAASAGAAALARGVPPLLHTARGPDDPRLAAALARRDALGLAPEAAAERIGRGLGRALGRLGSGAKRLVVAGGDSSGFVTQELGIRALTAMAPVEPGAPLMRAHGGPLDGREIVLKGGQMGGPNLLLRLRDGDP
jgi:uncharacterized protein YgbK (DUF1537 family)